MSDIPSAQTGRRPDELPTRVFDWGSVKWLITPNLDGPIGLTTGEVIVYPGKGHEPAFAPRRRGGHLCHLRRGCADGR